MAPRQTCPRIPVQAMNPTPFEQIYPAQARWLARTYRAHAPYFWPFWVSISGRVYRLTK